VKPTPFLNWNEVPISCRIEDVARITRMSVRTIYRLVDAHAMTPMPMSRVGKTSPLVWSKDDLMKHYQGGHAEKSNRKRCFSRVA
jgi:predicted DNA-binding transcriptional regulator AlpA